MSIVIAPVQHTRYVNCIIQDGVRYCENQPADPQVFGRAGVIVILWVLGFAWCLNEWVEKDRSVWLPVTYFLLPFLLLAIFG